MISLEVIHLLREKEREAEPGPWLTTFEPGQMDILLGDFGVPLESDDMKPVQIVAPHDWLSENGAMADAELVVALRNAAADLLDAAEWALENGYLQDKRLFERCHGGYPGAVHSYMENGKRINCPLCGGVGWRKVERR